MEEITEINPYNYYTNIQWNRLKSEIDKYPTPSIVVDLAIIEQNFKDLQMNFPYSKIYYAVKSNPNEEIMRHLMKLGTNFDIASVYEFDSVIKNGGSPEQTSYGNPIKKREDIKYIYDKGCRLFVSDSEEDLKNIAEYAPGSDVYFRLIFEFSGESEWPLSHKFGSKVEIIEELIPYAKKLGLNPRGISFHVGSQQNNDHTWCDALKTVSEIFQNMKEKHNIELDLINLGGGLPANYIRKHKTLKEYASTIKDCFDEYFPNGIPKTIIMEPGRSLFGNSGVLSTSVVLISEKEKEPEDKWLYIDAGLYNGLSETQGEAIHYPLYTEVKGNLTKKFIIAGPTCDSIDVIYKNFRNPLPENIKIGDKIYWLSCGAYSSSTCSVGFNGFPPIVTHIINTNEVKTNVSSFGIDKFKMGTEVSVIFAILILVLFIYGFLYKKTKLLWFSGKKEKKQKNKREPNENSTELLDFSNQ